MDAATTDLRRQLFGDFEQTEFPKSGPLHVTILHRRSYFDYDEWKIEYDVQSSDTMPVEAGRRIPAYLLVPNRGERPFPAMVCLHQCAVDCTIGKEAVVGKIPWSPSNTSWFMNSNPSAGTEFRVSFDRRDQAYAYELVHEGFVTLAPDSVNCGERNIEAIRQPGEARWCHGILDDYLGMEGEFKRTIDGMRAVDVLQSLDFVDSERIGAIGHSMGAEGVYWLMAFDGRVKAGIMGCAHMEGVAGRFYPLIAPRLLMALWGEFDIGDQDSLQEAYDFAYRCYREVGAADNLVIRRMDAGHRFADEFKWESYKRLKEYFGVLPVRRYESLLSMARDARDVTSSAAQAHGVEFPEIEGEDLHVLASRVEMISALSALFLYYYLDEDRPASVEDNLRWLREAGLDDVACHWRYFNFAIWSGKKPPT